MKNLTYFLASFFLLSLIACGNNSKTSPVQEPKFKSLIIFLYDISLTTDEYLALNEKHLTETYEHIASHGGGQFYALHIKTNSEKQDPIMMSIEPLDTLLIRGDFITQDKIRKHNAKLLQAHNYNKMGFLQSLKVNLLIEKNEKFTDLGNALKMAKMISEQNMYQGYEKNVVLISDCINDVKGGKNYYDPLSPFSFANDVLVSTIRPNTSLVNVRELFPTNSLNIHSSIDEYLLNLKMK